MKFLSLVTLTLGADLVNGHGYLSQPAASFQGGAVVTKYEALMTESCDPAFAGLKWDDNPEANTATFASAFPNSQFDTLRALMDSAAPSCGNTVTTGAPVDVSSLSSMKWQNDQEMAGFIDSHHGPCEAWIDGSDGSSTRVLQTDDCRRDYTGYPAEIPIDFSSCSGDCTFTFYWLALHEPNWQVYKQCAPIVNGGSTESRSALKSTSTTSAPAVLLSAEEATTDTTEPADSVYTTTSRCRARRRNLRSGN
ncbi:hypothetical protein PHYBOEH_008767 [Phytophthora boehmeriae]|uniref:Secreted protein n=1 Tax=Phytophthora boehmeriae TaxID=109152 RepID=A0A8T1W248_9STRA|nr:hypothetical protein PHYBOEH_008767 [Phytophthora boehmeriae]